MKFFRILVLAMLLFSAGIVSAQQERLDSIRKALHQKPGDRQLNFMFAEQMRLVNKDSALYYARQRLIAGESKRDSVLICDAYFELGLCHVEMSKFPEGIVFFRKSISYAGKGTDSLHRSLVSRSIGQIGMTYSLEGKMREAITSLDTAILIREALRDSVGLAQMLITQAEASKSLGDLPRAYKIIYRAIDIAQRTGSQSQEARAYNNLANIYNAEGKEDDALKSYRKSLTIKLKLGNKRDIANTYSNIGGVQFGLQQFDSALYYYNLALPMRIEVKDNKGTASTSHNIGLTYLRLLQYAKAEEYLERGLEIRRKIKDRKGLSSSYNALSEYYGVISNYSRSAIYADSSLAEARDLGLKPQMVEAFIHLAEASASLGKFKEAYQSLDSAFTIHNDLDSIQDLESTEQMKNIFNLQQKDKFILDLEHKREQERIQSRNQKYLFLAAGIFVLLILLFIINRYRSNQKSKAALQAAYNVIESRNKDITDSINYARHIQEAILPETDFVKKLFPGCFILYKPKDIVSGDFYWASEGTGGRLRALAVADCTGHGVPGAFMSVVGTEQLYRAAKDASIRTPSEALHAVDEGMRALLKQTGDSSGAKDGMDIALCAWDHQNNKLLFAGAFRPLYLVRGGELLEFDAARYSIGGAYAIDKKFIDHEIDLKPGDVYYLFTDGFADQFGGERGKKFKQKQLKELLCSIAHLEPEQQRQQLNDAFEKWRGAHEQIDDVCIIGVKV